MSRGPDAGAQLERALVQQAARAGVEITIRSADWERWASATFSGARHHVVCATVRTAALDAWLAALPEAEFRLRGHLVADLTIGSRTSDGDTVTLAIDVLTVEDR